MEKLPEDPNETKYALADYCKLLLKSKKLILGCMLFGAFACASYALSRHVFYLTSSSFRDKGKPQTSFGSSLTDFIFSGGSIAGDSETISTLKSRKLLKKVIDHLGLQAKVAPLNTGYPNVRDFFDNIRAEYAYWLNIKTPILEELKHPLLVKNVNYPGEIATAIALQFVDDTHFKIMGEAPETLFALGEPVTVKDSSFTLLANELQPAPLKNEWYTITFFPLDMCAKIHSALLVIEVDREDKTLLKLQFRHRDRHFASEFLNSLMAAYQDHLKEEHEYISNYHLDYLKDRQNETGASLQAIMEKHASRISDDLSSSGFLDAEKEMEFLAHNMHNLQQKISEIDFEKKRLEKLGDLDFVYYDQYGGRGDSAVINQLLGEIRNLKQQIDVLNLSLANHEQLNDDAQRQLLDEQFVELNNVRTQLREIHELSTAIAAEDTFSAKEAFDKSPKHLTPAWFHSLNQTNSDDQICYKDHFCSYLDNLKDMLRLKESTINERIKHQHHFNKEFQGITLETSRGLFLHYLSEINGIQSQIKQHKFVIEELKNPDFEVCSLTSVLHDPVSAERIGKASYLLIQLRDENNRTQKEMARIKDELETLKKFLSAHLEQMVELFELRENLLQEKIFSLQSLTLDLSYQQIYVLKKNLTDYLATRLDNLGYEKKLIKEYQADLNTRMAKIPSRWAAEKTILQHLASNQKFLENLSGMVESKNISKNLELIQSTPLDLALPSVNPKPPNAVMMSIVGAILGLISSVGFIVAQSLIVGVPASSENLKFAGIPCSGDFSKSYKPGTHLLDRDLNTLRCLVSNLEKTLASPRKILFICGQGIDASFDFASLISKKGNQILNLDLSFQSIPSKEELPGLLQFLEEGKEPKISHLGAMDTIASGGITRYGSELLRSQSFKDLLDTLESTYPWIVGVSHASIKDAEAINLSSLFDGIVIMLTDETIEEVKAFTEQLDRTKAKAVNAIFVR